ncbi:MAG: hypothetical protein HFH37_06900 [Lachnospiraceae bacterium]|nr:hypothetical protein [Lachnospiraceae bacterium]
MIECKKLKVLQIVVDKKCKNLPGRMDEGEAYNFTDMLDIFNISSIRGYHAMFCGLEA